MVTPAHAIPKGKMERCSSSCGEDEENMYTATIVEEADMLDMCKVKNEGRAAMLSVQVVS